MKPGLPFKFAFACFGAGIAVLIIVALVAVIGGTAMIPKITRDIAAVANVHPASGALSSLGAFLWFGSALILVFTGVLTSRASRANHLPFLLSSACLTLYLWADDFFMLHETLPWFFVSDVEGHKLFEAAILASLAVATVAFLFAFRRTLLSFRPSYLLLALFFLGASLVWDQVSTIANIDIGDWGYLAEDGSKWLGIIAWFVFYTDACLRILADPAYEKAETLVPPSKPTVVPAIHGVQPET